MQANTRVFIAVRNFGDKSDHGENFEGTLSDSLQWLVAQLGAMTMAGRIGIGIGRNLEGAEMAIRDGRVSGTSKTAKLLATCDFANMLDQAFAATNDPDDDYVPPV